MLRDNNRTRSDTLTLSTLAAASTRPAPWQTGDGSIWTDPHIGQQMLTVHLDPTVDAASRRPETIDRTTEWIMQQTALQSGDTLLDLGCGPGLYCQRWAAAGLQVTGVDFNPVSLAYARQHDRASTYIEADYLTLEFDATFDVVTMIFGDFNVLPNASRDHLLNVIRHALKPGGHFVFDVSTRLHHAPQYTRQTWSISDGGFWHPAPHLVLEQGFHYPDLELCGDQYIIIDDEGLHTYRVWHHYYNIASITRVLHHCGLAVRATYSDLMGSPYSEDSEWIGVVAIRA